MICRKCGAEFPEDAVYCDKCGKKLKSDEDTFIFKGLGDAISNKLRERGHVYDIEPEYVNSIGMKFKKISAGEFLMGSDEWPDAKPVHRVKITKSFYIGIYPVTQGEWKKVIKKNLSHFKGDNRPVERVSWDDCLLFIKKLNKKEGCDKYRLPTEAEWEYCCKAGNDTDYFFGNDVKKLVDYAWFHDNSKDDGTHSVGTKPPNPWGLSDMHGNVWEWCQDFYSPYPSGEVIDPVGASKGTVRINRGGGWCNDALMCSAVFRRFNRPNRRRHNLGFRLVNMI